MDLLPQLPQSVLFQMLDIIKMDENMIPVDLSAMNKQIESYIPLTTRIDDGRNFKSIMFFSSLSNDNSNDKKPPVTHT